MLSLLIGNPIGQPALAGFREGVEAWSRKDYATAVKEFRPLADQGNAEAQAYVGAAYLHGQGVPVDLRLAIDYLHRAAEQGEAQGQNDLAGAYLVGRGVARDSGEAAKWFHRAAEQGLASAQTSYGQMLLSGFGTPKNAVEGLDWLKKAAGQNNAIAEYFVGRAYFNGEGVPEDSAQGLRWLARSADHDNADAEDLLGLAYYSGKGTPQDYREAVKWFGKAAQLGRAQSQYMLGTLYLQGLGVPKDYELGYFWLSLAATNLPAGAERSNSLKAREFAAAKLSPEQLARTQTMARNWRPGTTSGIQLAAKPSPSVAPSAVAKPRTTDEFKHRSSGTGFIVNRAGDVLTNNHVVASCNAVRLVAHNGQPLPAWIVVRDDKADLALLHAELAVESTVTFREEANIRPGDEVVALGFPLPGMLANQVNVTTGNVSSLAGIGNDPRFLQISAPVQPGNSGGPIFDLSGNLVGVVTAKLNALALAKRTGDIAQNVNFALKASVARNFLDTYKIAYATASSERDLKPADIGERNASAIVFVECLRN